MDRLTHDVHAAHLGPDLGKRGGHGTIYHAGTKEVPRCDVLVLIFKLAHVPDVLQFDGDKRSISVAMGVHIGQHLVRLIPAIMTCQPTGRFR